MKFLSKQTLSIAKLASICLLMVFGLLVRSADGSPARNAGFDAAAWERFYEACRQDAAQFCPRLAPTATRMSHCLSDYRDQLSEGCHGILTDLSSGAARERLHGACAADERKWCANSRADEGSLARCMREHIGEFSDECQNEMNRLSVLPLCQGDIWALCMKPTQRDRLLRNCLLANERTLTSGCRDALP